MPEHTTRNVGGFTLIAIDEEYNLVAHEGMTFSIYELAPLSVDDSIDRQRVMVTDHEDANLANYIAAADDYSATSGTPVDATLSHALGLLLATSEYA